MPRNTQHQETFMALRAYRTLSLAGLLAAVSVLSGCATTYNSAGDSYFSVWPFIGSRNPELQLNFPAPTDNYLNLSRDPDPLYWISPQPPIDPRVTSPYSEAPADPRASMAAVSDNGACAESCDSQTIGAPVALRADAGDGRRIASR
jgi:hypothetical protein